MRILKYDLISQMKVILPAIAVSSLVAVMSTVIQYLLEHLDFENMEFLYYSLLVAHTISIYAINALVFYGFFMVCADFYRGIFGKEAYLTHTLPLKSGSIVLSKMSAGFISMYLCLATVFVLNFLTSMDKDSIFDAMQYYSKEDLDIIVVLCLAFLIQGITQLCAMYLAMALAHLTKNPIPFTIIYYLVLNSTVTFLPSVVTFSLMFTSELGMWGYLLVFSVLSGLFCLVFYRIVLHIVEKKLNLV